MSKPRVHRYVARDFTFRASVVDATAIVSHMQHLQGAAPVPTRALGRTMIGAILMAAHLKGKQSVGIYIQGDTELQSVYAEASYTGQVRAYTPQTELQIAKDPGFGKGYMTVQRSAPFQKQPYHGTVELLTGDVQDDIMYYLRQSQQIRGIIEVDVKLTAQGEVMAAGGLLIEVMPGVEDSVYKQILNSGKNQPQILEQILGGKNPEQIIDPFLRELPYEEIDHPYPLEYSCRCDIEKVKTTLAMLGAEEVEKIIEEGEPLVVRCQICGTPYHFSLEETRSLLSQIAKDSMH